MKSLHAVSVVSIAANLYYWITWKYLFYNYTSHEMRVQSFKPLVLFIPGIVFLILTVVSVVALAVLLGRRFRQGFLLFGLIIQSFFLLLYVWGYL